MCVYGITKMVQRPIESNKQPDHKLTQLFLSIFLKGALAFAQAMNVITWVFCLLCPQCRQSIL